MGSVTAPERAADSVEMCRILFGAENVGPNCYMTSLININSPLVFDATMMGALEVYARAGQAVIVSPFIVGGAMAPVSVAGTLTQVLAEAMTGIAYAQLVNPGCPVIFGAFVTSIDMNSGAPTFGTPEASKILWGAGQLARRLNLPFRSGGALCGVEAAGRAGGLRERQHAAGGAARRGELHAARLRLAGGRAGVELREVRARCGPARACCIRWRRGSTSPRTGRRWTRCARWGRAGISSAARTRRRTSRTRSGGPRCWTTGRSRPGRRRARPIRCTLANARVQKMLGEYEAPALDAGDRGGAGGLRGAAEGVGAGRVRVSGARLAPRDGGCRRKGLRRCAQVSLPISALYGSKRVLASARLAGLGSKALTVSLRFRGRARRGRRRGRGRGGGRRWGRGRP